MRLLLAILMIAIACFGAEETKRKAAPKKSEAKQRKASKWVMSELDSDQSAMRTKKTAKKK